MTIADRIHLASQSPRRRQLLDQIGVRHEVLLPDDGEDLEALEALRPGEAPDDYVQRVTQAKLQAARERLARRGMPDDAVLCADTTVALGEHILGKPRDAAEATAMLERLAGRTHRVLTAVAVARGERQFAALSVSHVRFDHIADDEIAAYVASGEPYGKAGGYAIQSAAAAWVQRIAGSYSGIMGLPLHETARLLKQAGVCFGPALRPCKTS